MADTSAFEKRNTILAVVIAVLHWILCVAFEIDRGFFEYDSKTPFWYLIKLLTLVFLISFWGLFFHIAKKIKEKNMDYLRGLQLFIPYFLFLLVTIIIVWPGAWSGDDAENLLIERVYGLTAWHNILTGIFHDILLQILPFPGGIILIQNLLIAIAVSFVIVRLEKHFPYFLSNRITDTIVKLLPFILPPVLFFQLGGFRIGVYIYLELVFLIVWFDYLNMKEDTVIHIRQIIGFMLLTVLVSVWRSESIVYIPLVALSVLIKKDHFKILQKLVFVFVMFVLFYSLSKFQSMALGDGSYKITSIISPCSNLIWCSDNNADKDLLYELDKGINVENVLEHKDASSHDLIWNYKVIRKGRSDEDYTACIIAFVKLSLRYPYVVFIERLKLFARSINVSYNNPLTFHVEFANNLLNQDNDGYLGGLSQRIRDAGFIYMRPILPNIRRSFFNLLLFKINGEVNKPLYTLFWCCLAPILALFLAFCLFLKNKTWSIVTILFTVLGRMAIVILTQPTRTIMYFLPFYLTGYIIIIWWITEKASKMHH